MLYEKVRSAAVHGSEPPEVTEADVRLFAGDVRWTLDEYLRYGLEQGFTRQSQLVAALDNHPERPLLIDWIQIGPARAAAGNGSNRVALRCPRSTGISPRTCSDGHY
jgi:hypothetical protein